MSKLSELLNARNPDRLSAREVGRRAEKLGYSMSPATATALFGGRHAHRPDDATLEALSRVLPITLAELREAAGVPMEPGIPWDPPSASRYLTRDERDVLDQLIRVMTKGGRAAGGDPPVGDVGPGGDGNVRELAGRTSRPMPPMDALAADEQDGPTVQDADGDLNRQNEAGEEDQGGPDEPA